MHLRAAVFMRVGDVIASALMRFAAQATQRVLTHLAQRLTLLEHEGGARGPWLSMTGQGGSRGHVRCYTARGIDKIVYLTLEDSDQLDAAMLMVFGAQGSALPHLVLDAAHVGRDYAVFVDLIPRVDLAVHPAYVQHIYGPFTDVLEGLRRHPKLRTSPVPATLLPFVSPWMAGFRCHEQVLPQLFELVAPFVSTWLALHGGEVPAVRPNSSELSERDVLHRAALFSSAADPVWDVLGTVVGHVSASRVMGLLQTHGVPPSPSVRPPPDPK